MTRTIIALTGRKYSGKDYLAVPLIEAGFTRVSFSDQLKKIANRLYPWCKLDYPSEQKEISIPHHLNVNGLSPRDIWIKMDKLREVDPMVFVRGALEEINDIEGDIVITDIRKEMELHACQCMKSSPLDDLSIIRITTNREGIEEDPDEGIIDHFNVDFEFHNTKEKQSVPDWKDFVWCVTGIRV